MKIACLGGGPAGLYFAISMKLRDAGARHHRVRAQPPDDTFGWGVVLSDETLDNLAANDPVSADAIRAHFAYWDDIAVHLSRRSASSRPATASAASAASSCCMLLQERARELGVELRFETEIAERRGAGRDLRSGRRRRRAELAGRAPNSPHISSPTSTLRKMQIRLARHAPEIRRRLHLHLRGDRARLDLGARLPVRRRHRDLHRRMLARRPGQKFGFGAMSQRGDHRRPASASSPSISAAMR